VSKHEVRIGAGDWYDHYDSRIGIYNSDYIGHFEKWRSSKQPWIITTTGGKVDLSREKFDTNEEAATYLREEFAKCAST
jgi:hypothetical protein